MIENIVKGDKVKVKVDEIIDEVNEQETIINTLINVFYPIGTLYESTSPTNPKQFMGGTWEEYGKGRVTVAINSSDVEFNTVGKTGGAKTHTLLIDQIPAHNHSYGNRTAGSLAADGNQHGTASQNNGYQTSNTGGGQPHNNLQPYITVYRFRRTA